MTETHARRLVRLAAFLDTLPAARFDMSRWGYAAPEFAPAPGPDPPPSCDTVGCAAGWAAGLPEFQALGLSLYPSDSPSHAGTVRFEPVTRFDREHTADQGYGRDSFTDACSFFGVTPDDGEAMFDVDGYRVEYGDGCADLTPAAAARRVREIVAKYFPAGVSPDGPLA